MVDDEFPRNHPEGEDVETFEVDAEWSREQFVAVVAGLAYLANVAAGHNDIERVKLAAHTQARLLWDNPELGRHVLTETDQVKVGGDEEFLLEHLGIADDDEDRDAVEIEIEEAADG